MESVCKLVRKLCYCCCANDDTNIIDSENRNNNIICSENTIPTTSELDQYWYERNVPEHIETRMVDTGGSEPVECVMYNRVTGEVYDSYKNFLARHHIVR